MSGMSNRHQTGPAAVRALRSYLISQSATKTYFDPAHLVRKLDEAGFCIVEKFGAHKAPEGRGNEAFKKVKEDRRIRAVGQRAAARRAKEATPVYTGPDLIGRSHTQNLLNGG